MMMMIKRHDSFCRADALPVFAVASVYCFRSNRYDRMSGRFPSAAFSNGSKPWSQTQPSMVERPLVLLIRERDNNLKRRTNTLITLHRPPQSLRELASSLID